MFILKNALKNLGRNKGRNILLGIIILVLILSATVALVINTTTDGIINDYKTRFGSKVTLGIDFDKLMNDTKPDENGNATFPTAPEIKPEQYLSFADSKHLKTYQMNMLTGIVFDGLKAVDEEDNSGIIGGIGGQEDYIIPTAKLLAYSDTDNLPDFASGHRKIVDGTLYQKKNECLVSSDFAALNELKVGDTFEVKDSASKKTITLKVAGIYADSTAADKNLPAGVISMAGSYENRRNEVLVNIDTMRESLDVAGLTVTAEYELKSPDLVGAFEKELREKGLPAAYLVETDENGYNKIVAPVVGLAKISMTFLWVILAVGSIILLFITIMAIRERKYEIGVLRAMGLKKAKVALMLVAETFMITAVCLGIGLGVGNAVSQPIADSLIAGQVEAAAESEQQNGVSYENGVINMGSLDADSDVEPLSEIDVSLTQEAAIKIILIALALALLTSAAGVVIITKYEPMKILSERN